MEGALKQVTEELTRSRADYTALFQNFKQSRILFEERGLTTKAHLHRAQKENKVLEGALNHLTGELNLCRSDYSVLVQNFERSSMLADERDEVCKATLEQLSEQIVLEHPLSQQRRRQLRISTNSRRNAKWYKHNHEMRATTRAIAASATSKRPAPAAMIRRRCRSSHERMADVLTAGA